MALRKILFLKNDEDILRKISKPVNIFDSRLESLLDDMKETMRKAEGVGLAAIQVGILKRAIVIETPDCGYCEFINPKILAVSDNMLTLNEGCLSIPGDNMEIKRPDYVKISYFDRKGEEHIKEFTGFTVRAILHETDHLDGILYIDRMND